MSKIALIEFNYETYAIPVDALSETLAQFAALRKVEKRYESGGYVYWYSDAGEKEISATIVSESRIQDKDPGKAQPPAPAQKQLDKSVDDRIIAAPSDRAISIQTVPPMRGFVDEYRHEDSPAVVVSSEA